MMSDVVQVYVKVACVAVDTNVVVLVTWHCGLCVE